MFAVSCTCIEPEPTSVVPVDACDVGSIGILNEIQTAIKGVAAVFVRVVAEFKPLPSPAGGDLG